MSVLEFIERRTNVSIGLERHCRILVHSFSRDSTLIARSG